MVGENPLNRNGEYSLDKNKDIVNSCMKIQV